MRERRECHLRTSIDRRGDEKRDGTTLADIIRATKHGGIELDNARGVASG